MEDQTETAAPPSPTLAPQEAGAPPGPEQCRFTFTGSGKEYFRIWIVNLALSVATLGIYSAWAKVRRLQYFDRNTVLAGASFDFHGDPKAILRGRLLGVVLAALYHYAYGFSLAAGAVVATAMLLALPFLFRSALRFRLANTTWRGLRFGFAGGTGGAYLAYLPPIAAVLLPGVLLAFDPSGRTTVFAFVLYLGWPLMHAAMKRYQHANLLYGAEPSRYTLPMRRFFGLYVRALLLVVAGVVAVIVVAVVLGFALQVARVGTGVAAVALPIGGVIAGYAGLLFAFAYVYVRSANMAWSHTALGAVQVESTLGARSYVRLQAANIALTLLTLGLYRPFAAVRVYRYRLACAALLAQGSFEQIAAGAAQRGGAGGDAVADLIGFDLSW